MVNQTHMKEMEHTVVVLVGRFKLLERHPVVSLLLGQPQLYLASRSRNVHLRQYLFFLLFARHVLVQLCIKVTYYCFRNRPCVFSDGSFSV